MFGSNQFSERPTRILIVLHNFTALGANYIEFSSRELYICHALCDNVSIDGVSCRVGI